MKDLLQCKPIGYFFSSRIEKYMVPRQAALDLNSGGYITLESNNNFEQALEDLEGFEKIWLIYWLHRNQGWKPKVQPPRLGPKRGVFATRSPHRPNPIGLSCVDLISIKGSKLIIGKNDLIDETPILDIKPYICYADAFPNCRQGWAGSEIPNFNYTLEWSKRALCQANYIHENTPWNLREIVELRLGDNPYPFPNHRIKCIDLNHFVLACKTWRIYYTIQDFEIQIEEIRSGYDHKTLEGDKISKWNDVDIHRMFVALFFKK